MYMYMRFFSDLFPGKEETLVVVVNDFLSEMSQIAGEPISEL